MYLSPWPYQLSHGLTKQNENKRNLYNIRQEFRWLHKLGANSNVKKENTAWNSFLTIRILRSKLKKDYMVRMHKKEANKKKSTRLSGKSPSRPFFCAWGWASDTPLRSRSRRRS